MADETHWIQVTSPLGFVVAHPPGWRVEADSIDRIVICSAGRGAFAFVYPFLLPQPVPSLTWLQQVPGLFPTLFPQALLLHSRQFRLLPDEAIGSLVFA